MNNKNRSGCMYKGKNPRYKLGIFRWYRMPWGLPGGFLGKWNLGGDQKYPVTWESWEAKIKKICPIQHWFRDTVYDWLHYWFVFYPRQKKYELRDFFNPHNIWKIKTLKKSYCDPQEKLIHGIFYAVDLYLDECERMQAYGCFEQYAPEHTSEETALNEGYQSIGMKDNRITRHWRYQPAPLPVRPAFANEFELADWMQMCIQVDAHNKIVEAAHWFHCDRERLANEQNDMPFDTRPQMDASLAREKELEELETKMLKQVIDYRTSLWT